MALLKRKKVLTFEVQVSMPLNIAIAPVKEVIRKAIQDSDPDLTCKNIKLKPRG